MNRWQTRSPVIGPAEGYHGAVSYLFSTYIRCPISSPGLCATSAEAMFGIAFLFIRHSKSHLSRNLMPAKDAVTFKEDMMNFVSIPYPETNRGCKYYRFQIGQRDYTGEKLF